MMMINICADGMFSSNCKNYIKHADREKLIIRYIDEKYMEFARELIAKETGADRSIFV